MFLIVLILTFENTLFEFGKVEIYDKLSSQINNESLELSTFRKSITEKDNFFFKIT